MCYAVQSGHIHIVVGVTFAIARQEMVHTIVHAIAKVE